MPKRLTPFLAILSIVAFGTIIAHTFWEKNRYYTFGSKITTVFFGGSTKIN
jgi:hypothetical protein